VTALVTPPEAVAVKVAVVETVTAGAAGLIAPTLTTWGVTVTVFVAVAGTEFVTVKV
jgi:hypothetical protein